MFPISSNYSPSVQKAVVVCKSKVRCPRRIEERLNKRKLGVNLTDHQLKIYIKRFNANPFKGKNAS